jgi:hypothetical protein
MIKIQLAELPPVRTDGAADIPTDTFMRLQMQWQHADVSLAIYIWTFMVCAASAGRVGPFSADDLQRETLPQEPKKRLKNSEVERCMAHLAEFGIVKLSSEPDPTP